MTNSSSITSRCIFKTLYCRIWRDRWILQVHCKSFVQYWYYAYANILQYKRFIGYTSKFNSRQKNLSFRHCNAISALLCLVKLKACTTLIYSYCIVAGTTTPKNAFNSSDLLRETALLCLSQIFYEALTKFFLAKSFFFCHPGCSAFAYTIPFRDPWHIFATWRRGMGVFGLQTLVGRHRDLNPGPPAWESGV